MRVILLIPILFGGCMPPNVSVEVLEVNINNNSPSASNNSPVEVTEVKENEAKKVTSQSNK